MARLEHIDAGFYRIPLAEPLADSARPAIRAFEIVAVRVRDADGAEGVGYTFTGGHNGAAIHATMAREIPDLALGQDADLIEALWRRIWWALHYGGHGGAPYEPLWLEEPTIPEDVAGHAESCARAACQSPLARTCAPSGNSRH
jgi:L-alanine-DL-glutamate epimerase-like enolase superfamily enzyme